MSSRSARVQASLKFLRRRWHQRLANFNRFLHIKTRSCYSYLVLYLHDKRNGWTEAWIYNYSLWNKWFKQRSATTRYFGRNERILLALWKNDLEIIKFYYRLCIVMASWMRRWQIITSCYDHSVITKALIF